MLTAMNSQRFVLCMLLIACGAFAPLRAFADSVTPIDYQVILHNPQTQMVGMSIRVRDVDGPNVVPAVDEPGSELLRRIMLENIEIQFALPL